MRPFEQPFVQRRRILKLDDDYANAAYIPNAEGFLTHWEDAAREYREAEHSLGRAQLNLSYGNHPEQVFDLFFPAGQPLGLLVFVHGGYWMRFGRRDFSHLARGATLNDWAVALPSYPLAPEATIPEITQSVVSAINTAAARVAGPIVLTGHSAGGHLVARMGQANIGLLEVVYDRITRIVPVSPVSDLRPLMQTSMNETLKLTTITAKSESPALHLKPKNIGLHVWVGANERPVFIEQAELLATKWKSTLTLEPSRHHFDVIEGLEDPNSPLINVLLEKN